MDEETANIAIAALEAQRNMALTTNINLEIQIALLRKRIKELEDTAALQKLDD